MLLESQGTSTCLLLFKAWMAPHLSRSVLAEDPSLRPAALPCQAAQQGEESCCNEVIPGRVGSALTVPSEVSSSTSMPSGVDFLSHLLVVI